MNNPNICPFYNHVLLTLTPVQKLQIAIASITIVPIRLVFIILNLLILWIIGPLPTIGRTEEDKKKPIDGWRLWVKPIITFFSRSLFFFGGFHWISVYGKEDPNVRILACAPHSSFLDVLTIALLKYPSAIGRAGAEDVPLFGYLTKLTQPLIVDRDSKTSRTEAIKKIYERVNSPLKWPKLFIFAEGTCTNRKALMEFKLGPFLPGKPVQPVCIKYNDTIDSISWPYKGPSVWWLALLTLCKLHNSFEFHYLPVYYPNDEEKQNPELYANNVRLVMAKYLNIPISDYSFEDIRLMTKFESYKLPCDLGKIKVNKVKQNLGISLDAIFELIPLYSKLVDKKTGIGNIDTLSQHFDVTKDKLNDLLKIFDKENRGSFQFLEFLYGYHEVILKSVYLNNDKIDKLLDMLEINGEKIDISKRIYNLIGLNLPIDKLTRVEFEDFLRKNPLYTYLLINLTQKLL